MVHYKIVVVTNDMTCLNNILKILANDAEIIIVEVFASYLASVDYINSKNIDLLIIDDAVLMGKPLQSINSILKNSPELLLISDKLKNAAMAYSINAFDFILKPIKQNKLIRSIDKFKSFKKFHSNSVSNNILKIKKSYKTFEININEIVYLESFKHYLVLHTLHEEHRYISTLKLCFSNLPATNFVQIHKSFVVNTNHILSYNSQEVDVYGGNVLPIGRSYLNDFRLMIAKCN